MCEINNMEAVMARPNVKLCISFEITKQGTKPSPLIDSAIDVSDIVGYVQTYSKVVAAICNLVEGDYHLLFHNDMENNNYNVLLQSKSFTKWCYLRLLEKESWR